MNNFVVEKHVEAVFGRPSSKIRDPESMFPFVSHSDSVELRKVVQASPVVSDLSNNLTSIYREKPVRARLVQNCLPLRSEELVW